MRYDPIARVWFFVEWSRAGLDIRTLTREMAIENIMKLMEEATCWEYIAPPRRSDYRKLPPLILYCVSVIKELLGIRAWWVWTPYQLARELERLGAKRIFHE